MTLHTPQRQDAILALLFIWTRHHLKTRLRVMRPAFTTEQIAATVAVTGNPSGA